jgi:prepilin-type N-terminal cleavage/methylation domain-containing protein
MKKMRMSKRGFTLTEIIIVVAIIVIVAAGAFVGVGVALENAKRQSGEVNRRHGQGADGKELFEDEAWDAVDSIAKNAAKFFDVNTYDPDEDSGNNVVSGDNNTNGGDNGGGSIDEDNNNTPPTTQKQETDEERREREKREREERERQEREAAESRRIKESIEASISQSIEQSIAESIAESSRLAENNPPPTSNASGSSVDLRPNDNNGWNSKLKFNKKITEAIIYTDSSSFAVNLNGQYNVEPLGNNRYRVYFCADGWGSKAKEIPFNVNNGTQKVYIESFS